ncbi:unnamed protein product, partial [marine sediment metagenome]
MKRVHASTVATSVLIAAIAAPTVALKPVEEAAGRAGIAALERVPATVIPGTDATTQAELRRENPALEALRRAADGPWTVDFDTRTGLIRRGFGAGIPLIAGPANDLAAPVEPSIVELEMIGRAFIAHYGDLFGPLDVAQWRLSEEGTQAIADGLVQSIRFVREVGGVPVENAQIQLVLNRGNLTYVNATGLDPVT